MKLYYKKKDLSVNAIIEWDEKSNTFTVLKGSIVSANIAPITSFRSANAVTKARSNGTVIDQKLMADITFKSASTAANFINGSSTNGLMVLKDIKGRLLKEIIAEKLKK